MQLSLLRGVSAFDHFKMHIDRLLFGGQTASLPLLCSCALLSSLATATATAFDSCLAAKKLTGHSDIFIVCMKKGQDEGRLARMAGPGSWNQGQAGVG